MDKETAIKGIEKGIRLSESVDSGWVWITIEQARKLMEIPKGENDERREP